MSQCNACDRALAPCEWCGTSDVLNDDQGTWPVITRIEWDGTFHEPCRAAYVTVLSAGR